MNYQIAERVYNNIYTFYLNVAKKYKNTFTQEDMENQVNKVFDSIYKIENGLLRRAPILSRWKGYYMANSHKWYFAYRIDGETIYVDDACYAQNMHEAVEYDPIRIIKEWMVRLDCIS